VGPTTGTRRSKSVPVMQIEELEGKGKVSAVEDLARAEYEHLGWQVVRGGAPDFLLLRETVEGPEFAFSEVKGPFDRLRPRQHIWLGALQGLGARVEVAKIIPGKRIQFLTPTRRSGGKLELLPEINPARQRASSELKRIRAKYNAAANRQFVHPITVYFGRKEYIEIKERLKGSRRSLSQTGRDLIHAGLRRKEEKR